MENEFMYFSKVTKKPYETLEDLQAAEKEVLDAQKAEEEKKAVRAERAKEVEEAFKVAKEADKKAQDLLNKFCKDYGAFHTTLHSFEDVMDRMFPSWF